MKVPKIHLNAIENQRVSMAGGCIPFGTIPFIIEGVADQWKAFRQWSPDYLSRRYGNVMVTCLLVQRTHRNFLQQVNSDETLSFGRFLDYISGKVKDEDHLRYLRIDESHPLFSSLMEDLDIPDFLDRYNPDATGIWMGQKGNLTPFHHDWWHSCLAQVAGKKRFLLVHPLEMPHLIRDWEEGAQFDLSAAPYYAPGDKRLSAIDISYEDCLEAGQVLYIPPFWFHQIETMEDANISLPIRYDTAQTFNMPLLQLSQDSILRELTNEQVTNAQKAEYYLQENRKRFLDKEKRFVSALVTQRNIGADPEEILPAKEEQILME